MATSSKDQSGYVVDIDKTCKTDTTDDVSKPPKECESDSFSKISNLKPWKLVCVCLLVSTLFQSLKPSDPYLPRFFFEEKGISKAELTNEIFQYRTYTYLFALLPVSLLSEVLTGYAPVIIVGLLCRLATQFAHYYASGAGVVQLGYVLFGLSQSTKIIYSAHLYRMVPVHVFHRVTGYLRAANLTAHVVGGFLGAVIVGKPEESKIDINWLLIFSISQTAAAIGVIMFVLACFFAWKSNKEYEATESSSVDDVATEERYAWSLPNESLTQCISRHFLAFIQMMRTIYSSSTVIVWSLWWCIGFAIVELLLDFQSVLFEAIGGNERAGYVFSGARLCAAGAALVAGRSRSIVDSYGLQILSLGSIFLGAILFVSSFATSIYLAYAGFVLFLGLHEFCFCSSNAQVAVRIPDSMRGVALVSNTFFSMMIQSLLQILPKLAGFDIRQKYVVFAIVMAAAGVMIFVLSFFLPKDTSVSAVDADGKSASSGAGQARIELDDVDGKKTQV